MPHCDASDLVLQAPVRDRSGRRSGSHRGVPGRDRRGEAGEGRCAGWSGPWRSPAVVEVGPRGQARRRSETNRPRVECRQGWRAGRTASRGTTLFMARMMAGEPDRTCHRIRNPFNAAEQRVCRRVRGDPRSHTFTGSPESTKICVNTPVQDLPSTSALQGPHLRRRPRLGALGGEAGGSGAVELGRAAVTEGRAAGLGRRAGTGLRDGDPKALLSRSAINLENQRRYF